MRLRTVAYISIALHFARKTWKKLSRPVPVTPGVLVDERMYAAVCRRKTLTVYGVVGDALYRIFEKYGMACSIEVWTAPREIAESLLNHEIDAVQGLIHSDVELAIADDYDGGKSALECLHEVRRKQAAYSVVLETSCP